MTLLFLQIFIGKLIFLYFLIFLGFIAGRALKIKRESIASLLIYIIAPAVVFNGVITTRLSASTLSLPLLFLVIGSLICLIFYFFGGFFWKTSERNILAFTAGSGNTGYFGLPVVLALFGERYLGIAVLLTLGIIFFEHSLGFFITAKGNHTVREAVVKLAKLPTLYAFLCGIVLQMWYVDIPSSLVDIFSYFRGTYTILGMMLIGLGMAGVTRASIDSQFTGMAFLGKFVVWPVFALAVVVFDMYNFRLWTMEIHRVILLLSVVPLASNTVAFATQLNTHPEKAALTVLLSTLFAIGYIPLFIFLIFPLLNLSI